jgi:hypothetical protein
LGIVKIQCKFGRKSGYPTAPDHRTPVFGFVKTEEEAINNLELAVKAREERRTEGQPKPPAFPIKPA